MAEGSDRGATIYDIARLAGVSPSTVSRTFSRPDRVSFRTAEKVRGAAQELGYRLDVETIGSASAKGQARNLGLVVADITNPFFQEVFRGAEHAARLEGMLLTVTDTQGSVPRAKTAVELLMPTVDGLLLASTRLANGDIQKIARTIPTVCINRPVPGVPSVLVNNYEGAIRAVEHLESQGVRSITYLAGPTESWADASRWRGLLDAADPEAVTASREPVPFTRGVLLPPETAARLSRVTMRQQRVAQPTTVGGRRAFELWRENPTDAVICFNDLVAIGFLDQAHRAGMDVPRDVAVVGCDNTEITSLVHPGLTTIAGPLRSLGRVAAANLMAVIRGVKGPSAKPRVLPTRLIVRGSSLRTRE
ncbi:LacI family DNA-binding transcriptional regulator [Corynebacterium comes]|uniref:HTH-type transcriptional repressor CytR n=1 Tax=Corynebacterium comes TaxID=2675218 RepID=A0A6B8W376_9CORY|nr:LacI family DNA-binding transcriptional regulator [Corynebacterium comes]QGU05386.1 HTH-type transcriptional repressor CytR [Corynebacterium comes]